MAAKQIIQEWLSKAEEDFGFASQTLAEPKIEYYAQICFHFQQAAEKYLKTYIVAKDLTFKKIHDLPQLLKICCESDLKLKELEEACDFLTDYYIDTRYPVHWPTSILREEAEKAKTFTEKIRDTIKSFL